MAKKFKPKNIKQTPNPFVILIIIALIGSSIAWYNGDDLLFKKTDKKEVTITELLKSYQNNELESIKIKDQEITAKLKGKDSFLTSYKEASSNIRIFRCR